MDSGGWQAVKAARALYEAGSVLEAAYDGTTLKGTILSGGRPLACGLLIRAKTDVENLCRCPESRRDGRLCAHSLALGFAHLRGPAKTGASAASRPGSPAPAAQPPPKPAAPALTAFGPLVFRLAPNFLEGLRRSRLVLGVSPEGKGTSPDDAAFLRWLQAQKVSSIPPTLALGDRSQIDALFMALAGHPRVFLGREEPLRIANVAARLPLDLQLAGDTVRLRAETATETGALFLPPAAPGHVGWLVAAERRKILPVRVADAFFDLVQAGGRTVEKPLRWVVQHLDALQEDFAWDAATSAPELLRLRRRPAQPRFHLELDGTLDRLSAKLTCSYPGLASFAPTASVPGTAFPLSDPADPLTFLDRAETAEAAALARLERHGFAFSNQDNRFVLKTQRDILQFFAGELERLKRAWDVTFTQRFSAASASVERVQTSWSPVSSGEDWLAFDLKFATSSGASLDRAEIQRLLQTGQGHRRLPGGKIAVVALDEVDDLNEVLRDLGAQQSGSGSFRINKAQSGYLADSIQGANDFTQNAEVAPWPVPADLRNIVRSYQAEGIAWLSRLAQQGLGGILADEMGLGKTLQSLALISAYQQANPGRPALVVCPKSLTGNWAQEAARFVPDVKTLIIQGQGATRTKQLAGLEKAGLVITSYQLLIRDMESHQPVPWGLVILDEAGYIRNPDTQASKAVRKLRAAARFALTGTPVENSIRDLWSIMDFAVPGYLGRRDDFRDRYEAPLAAGGAPAVMSRLRRRLAPYLLRRLKQQVAKDLPSKIEKVVTCALSPVQEEIYARLLREGGEKVLEAERQKQKSQARLHMLTALLRLRQTSCDPRLLNLNLPENQSPAELSGKIEALTELLEEIKEGGHSVLIFSQFATMLNLLKDVVTGVGLDYCHLDGQTTDREAQIRAFRDQPEKRVFLISLKAGGFGLNLTKADTVIHFDPWWNPAVEAQATDRAHRIGQDRPVTVYKLVSAGTVEEKILRLQRKKRGLMDAALDDAAPLMDGLADDELRDLIMTR